MSPGHIWAVYKLYFISICPTLPPYNFRPSLIPEWFWGNLNHLAFSTCRLDRLHSHFLGLSGLRTLSRWPPVPVLDKWQVGSRVKSQSVWILPQPSCQTLLGPGHIHRFCYQSWPSETAANRKLWCNVVSVMMGAESNPVSQSPEIFLALPLTQLSH